MLLIKGIMLGLMLTIMVGPITFTLIQVAVERGLKPGLLVAGGVWISDLLYILGVYFGVERVHQLTSGKNFEWYLGLMGGILLISFGLGTLWSTLRGVEDLKKAIVLPAHPLSLLTKGFLVNTVNPFTVFFWLGVISKASIEDNIAGSSAILYLGGIIGTVAVTDTLKVVAARSLSRFLSIHNILILRRISAIALIVFGAVLIYRVA